MFPVDWKIQIKPVKSSDRAKHRREVEPRGIQLRSKLIIAKREFDENLPRTRKFTVEFAHAWNKKNWDTVKKPSVPELNIPALEFPGIFGSVRKRNGRH